MLRQLRFAALKKFKGGGGGEGGGGGQLAKIIYHSFSNFDSVQKL